jgi:deoxyribodipyrimidine photolyase-related protein
LGVPHPAQSLPAPVGADPEIADAGRLFEEAVRICGAAATGATKGEGCVSCGFNPGRSFWETACPFSTLYWDFLVRHEAWGRGDARFAGQMEALAGLTPGDRATIRNRAMAIRLNAGRRPAATDVRPIA